MRIPKIPLKLSLRSSQEKEKEEKVNEKELEDYEKEALEAIEQAKKVVEALKVREERKFGRRIQIEYNIQEHGELIEYEPPKGWKIVEDYWIIEPFCKVYIIYNEEEQDYRYVVVEPRLSPLEVEIYGEMLIILRDELERYSDEKESKEVVLKKNFDRLLQEIGFNLEHKSYYKIFYYIIRDFLFYGKVTALILDKMLEDISCNGYRKHLYVFHKNYANIQTNVIFEEEDELDSFVVNLAQKCGKHISVAEPMVDATMPDGSRVQITLGKEVTDHGSTFTIRKFREEPVTPVDLIAWGTFSSEQMAYLWLCIENKKSLIFAGGTASGKTTSMNAISLFIPRRAKIVSIEDTRELMLPHENWI
ncbi:MAG: type II/IV secretion system ATPase subunit, partial [Archaeoglobales archaeon]|nr:type II/IV secretion system ATPase subunit [Archaeoglobales archaeon]